MAALPGDVSLGPLYVPRASDVLASTLRDQILSGQYAVGDSLPTERELIAYTQVSRTTVREALRILESQGFVEMRTGRLGGPIARRPGSEAVEQSVRFAIQGDQTAEFDIVETRAALEPACAALAAKYRTEEDLERMDIASAAIENAAQRGSAEDFVLGKFQWHLAVAIASHNSLLIGLMTALGSAIHESTDAGVLTEGMLAETGSHHTLIADAIRARDGAGAERFMRDHVGHRHVL
ncbi:FadR/GntR family transcriptional regulator [Microbacterium aurum]